MLGQIGGNSILCFLRNLQEISFHFISKVVLFIMTPNKKLNACSTIRKYIQFFRKNYWVIFTSIIYSDIKKLSFFREIYIDMPNMHAVYFYLYEISKHFSIDLWGIQLQIH